MNGFMQKYYKLSEIASVAKSVYSEMAGENIISFADDVPDEQQIRFLGILEYCFTGVEHEKQRELEAAYENYKKAVDLGCIDAMKMIGNLYFHEKFRSVKVSVAQKMADKIRRTGTLVFMPWDMMEESEIPDLNTAFEWYNRAAELGDLDALNNAGIMLYNGEGCERNIDKAREYISKAAAQGHEYAQKAYMNLFLREKQT